MVNPRPRPVFQTAERYGDRRPQPGTPPVRHLVQRPAEWVAHAHWNRDDYELFVPAPDATDTSHATFAYVNRSRWVARCPFCPGAQLVHPDDRRYFCVDCLSIANGHRWVPVIWPPDPAAIEQALTGRPVEYRNWEPPETVAQLFAENTLKGWG